MEGLEIEARNENLGDVLGFVDEQLALYGCPVKTQMKIDLAVEEIFVNISNYAYHPDVGSAKINIEVSGSPMTIVLTFVDQGIPYDPLAKADPNVNLPAEEREIGGLGFFLVKKSMDEVQYEYKEGQNILRIRKGFDA